MNRWLPLLALILGVYCCAVSAILLRSSSLPAIDVSCYRLLGAVVVLAPLWWLKWRKHRQEFRPERLKFCVLPGVVLALHLVLWSVGVRMTATANATLVVNMVPLVLPFFLLAMVGERVVRGEVIGSIIAVGGLVAMGIADFQLDAAHFYGDVVCFVSMLFFAWYLAFGRRNAEVFPDVWLYTVPLYLVAGIVAFGLSWCDGIPPVVPTGKEWWIVAGLVVIPTIFGHGFLLLSLKALRGQVVGVVNLGQFIFAGIMAAFFFGELPNWSFYLTTVLVVTGAVMVVLARGGGVVKSEG